MHRLCCYTLFDITQTGVMTRSKPQGLDVEGWLQKRNTQCNFDTILQVISLRSQPEMIKIPHLTEVRFDEFDKFGFLYEQEDDKKYACWKFEFEVQHTSVFENTLNPLGALYKDCEGVPMIVCLTQYQKIPAFLDTSPDLKNIHFEVL
jgi:hypothetical protein